MSDKQPDIARIQSYLNGELDAVAMHQMEKQAQADPFLMDALEGYEASGANQQANITQLKAQLAGRVGQNKKRVIGLWRIASIAACLFMFLTIGWFWLVKPQQGKNDKQTVKLIAPKAQPRADTVMPPAPVLPPAAIAQVSTPKHLVANVVSGTVARHRVQRPSVRAASNRMPDGTPTADVANTRTVQPIVQTTASNTTKTPPNEFVTGKITDAAGQTLPGVSLTLADGSTVTTDADGMYKIQASLIKDSVTVQMMGYNTQKVALKGPEALNISLSESANALPAVVVETKAIKNPPHAKPEPLGGWKAYLEYIRQNAVMPDGQTGRVKLAFLVDTNGGISNIKVIRGRSEAMNSRAIAMVLNGPPWEGSSDETVKKVKLKIRFRKS